jgi:integrase
MPIKKVRSKRFKQGYGYQVTIDRKGLPRMRKTFETLSAARDVEEAVLGDHVRRKYNLPVESHKTLRDLVERHLETMKAKGRDRTNWKRAETVLNRFCDLAGEGRMVESVRTADLQLYVSYRLRNGHKKNDPPKLQTINREMNEIKGCLSAAARYYPSLESWQPPKGAWLEEPTDGRRQTWTEEQIEAVLAELYAPRRWREKEECVRGRYAIGDMFRVALQTGMRVGEVRKLSKSQVSFSKGIITITSRKGMSARRSATTREIPMTEAVREILRSRSEQAKGEYLFHGNSPNRPLSSQLRPFKSACERAGIPYGLDGDGRLIFNDARRTAENNMLDRGHGARAVGDILGHSAETMARHYARSTAESRRAAIEAAKNFGGILVADYRQIGRIGQTGQRAKRRKGVKK